jgi:hypothetical protein
MAGTLAASPPAGPSFVTPPVDEAAARRSLRAQIARLEGELGRALTSVYPALPAPAASGVAPSRVAASHPTGPRLLGLGELERIRDRLAAQLSDARAAAAAQGVEQAASRMLVEDMLLAPGEHRWVRVSAQDVGEPSCKVWQVRPRLGLIGMLMGWWRVKISSGCPLSGWIADGPPLPQAGGRLRDGRAPARTAAAHG